MHAQQVRWDHSQLYLAPYREEKEKNFHVFPSSMLIGSCWKILVTRQGQFGEFCLGFLLFYCDNNLSSFGNRPCGRGGFLEL